MVGDIHFGLLSTKWASKKRKIGDDNWMRRPGGLQRLQPSFSHRGEDQSDSDRAEVTDSEEDDLTEGE